MGMRLGLGAVGAVVGSFVGMPQLGFAIGSFIGGALDKPDPVRNAQPIMDLRIPGTQDGNPIHWIRGSMRVAPDWAWHSDRRAITTSTTTEVGKGGGQEVENQETTYEMDCLFLLNINGGIGISEIYDRGDLIWRTDSGASVGTISASLTAEHWDRLTVYNGASDQLPDPDYEAWVDANVGEGLAPAYRGRMTVFVKGLKLGQSGAIRQLEFTVVTDGESGPLLTYFTGITTTSDDESVVGFDSTTGEIWETDAGHSIGGPDRVGIYNLESASWEYITLPDTREISVDDAPQMLFYADNDVALVTVNDAAETGRHDTFVYKISTRELIGAYSDVLEPYPDIEVFGLDFDNDKGFVVDRDTGNYLLISINDTGMVTGVMAAVAPATSGGIYGRVHVDGDGSFYANRGGTAGVAWTKMDGSSILSDILQDADGIWTDKWGHCYDPSRNCIYYWSAGPSPYYIKKLDCETGVLSRVNATGYAGSDFLGQLVYASDTDRILAILPVGGGSPGKIRIINPDDGEIEDTRTLPSASGSRFIGGLDYAPGVLWGPSPQGFGEYRFNVITTACPTPEEVQESIFLRAGLAESQVDVTPLSALSREVCAFPWSQISAAREPTERMQGVYFYETVMSGAKIKCVPRGEAVVDTIPYADLGARMAGEGGDEDPLPLRLVNDIETPAHNVINYINLAQNYNPGTEQTDRLMTATPVSVQPLEVAVGMQPAEAKGVIDTQLRDRASALVRGRIRLLRSDYPTAEPTDCFIIVGHDGSEYRMRAVNMIDSFPLVTFDVVLDDPNVLSAQGITTTDYESQTTVSSPADTELEFLDSPIFRDADNDAGFYLAAHGDRTPWPGAAVFDSNNGVDYTRRVTYNDSAVFGTCDTALGDWDGPSGIDERNKVMVSVGNATLASTTRAAAIASQTVNMFMLGDECVQAITATFVEDGVYDLSRLIRGARGTEWAMTGHAAGERCVLIRETGFRRIVLINSQIGDERYYAAVTLGRPLGTATPETFTNTAIGLKPFAPVGARIVRDGSNNATITGRRRTRLSTRYVGTMGISVPLGEDSESYELDVYSDDTFTTVVRTITASSGPTFAYTAAEQTADSLTPGDPISARMFMISAAVGRGYALEFTK